MIKKRHKQKANKIDEGNQPAPRAVEKRLTLLAWVAIFVIWTLITLFLALQNVHDYSVKETIRCIVLTLVFMIIALIIALIVLIMGEQLLEFLRTVFEEVLRNIYD